MSDKRRGGAPQLTFRIGGLEKELAARGSTNDRARVAKRDLGRYYELLKFGEREILELQLTADEVAAVRKAIESHYIGEIRLSDAVPRLSTVSPLGHAALLDLLERAR